MDALISISVVGFILLHAALYARVAFLRRHIMMPKVMAFLDREDASVVQKTLAKNAFSDALSVEMPLMVLRSSRKIARGELSKDAQAARKEIASHCAENTEANEELMEIIYLMFRLNFKFNFLLHMYATLRKCQFRKAVHIRASDASRAYANINMHHQH